MDGVSKNGTNNVGYGKPPEHSRFKPGRSGNAKGRPPGTLNLATMLQRILREKVLVNDGGHRKLVTKLEAAITQLVDKAASGDSHSIRHLCQLVASAEERSVEVEPATQFSEIDQKVLDNILKRFEKSLKEETNESDPE